MKACIRASILVVFLAFSYGQTYAAQQTPTQIKTSAALTFTANGVGAITGPNVGSAITNIADSFIPLLSTSTSCYWKAAAISGVAASCVEVPPGGGTVTQFIFIPANGFTGTVTTPYETPTLTLGTSVTGILKGNGSAISAATSSVDYAPATSGSSLLLGNGTGGFTALGNLTAGFPLIGNGTGTPTQGTLSGDTSKFATSNGALTNGDCVSLDSSGNYIDAGGPCTTGGGGGTVTAGTAGRLPYYAVSGNTVVESTVVAANVVSGSGTTAVLDIPTWSNTTHTAIDDRSAAKANRAPALVVSAQPSYFDGYTFRFPRMYSTVTPGASYDNIFGEPSSIVQPSNHSFVGCILCEFYESAAGTTAFVGTDGSQTPVLGHSGGGIATTAHMTAFGPSVICDGDVAMCIGRRAETHSAGDIILGSAKHTGGGTGGNILVGGTGMTSTSSGGVHIGIGTGTFSTGSAEDILIGNTTCTIGGTISDAIGIGRNACPSATGSIVLGGQFATKLYAGSESVSVPVYASGIVSQGIAPSTNFGTCTLGTWTGGPWVGKFLSSGACATGGQYYWTTTKTPPNGLACWIYDQSNPAVAIVPITGTGASSIKMQVTSATGVANNDVIVVSCQGY